jgi:uncharacterized protein involved in type VI secretion and phage assembly
MALKNATRHLTVETPLGLAPGEDDDDPLLLARVSGAEGISMPYAFELTMIGDKDTEIAPDELIGRPASFGIRKTAVANDEQEEGHNRRFGVFETFERLGTLRGRRIFRGRLVPAFRMTAYEHRYRVFEQRDLVSILREVLEPFPLVDLRTNLLTELGDAKIPYCVQYDETTFAFVHRLLDRFGVAYRFEHEEAGAASKPGLRRERMVLSCRDHRPDLVDSTVDVQGGEGSGTGALDGRSAHAVYGFRRSFAAAAQNTYVGDFNTIDPRRPPESRAAVERPYAFNKAGFRQIAEAFPVHGIDPADPEAAARLRMRQSETASISAVGRAYSSGFRAGRMFFTDEDRTGSGAEHQGFILRLVTIEAFDIVDDRSLGEKLLDALGGLIFGGNDPEDMMGAAAEQLRDRLKGDIAKGTEIANWLKGKQDAGNPSGLPGFIADKLGRVGSGLFAGIAAALPAIKEVAGIVNKLQTEGAGFACAFEAIPTSPPLDKEHWPTPKAGRPVAHGPHFALVVGPKGVATDEQDIWTDALGRVRIRFPWDHGPRAAADDPDVFLHPLSTDRVTAWVRVSEGWAGARFGSQFLPRIGQEVLVGFIDGDPERPLVTGRLYNAGSGRTHLPFPSSAAAAHPIARIEDLDGTQTSQATRSGIRTRSTPQGKGDAGFHLLRFDDRQGKEQLVLRAEHRLDTTSTGSRYDTTRGNRHTLVGGGKAVDGTSGGGDFTSVGGEVDLAVGDARYTRIKADDHLIIGGRQLTEVADVSILSAGGIVQTAEIIALEAKHQIQLVVGGAMVVITPAGVFAKGAIIDLQSASAQPISPPEIMEPVGAAEADPGDPADWLAQQQRKGGGGGGRRSHRMQSHRGMMVRQGEAGTLVAGGEKGGRGIYIDPGEPPDPAFVNRTVGELQQMRDDPATAKSVDAAEQRKNPVVISQGDPSVAQPGPYSTPADPKGAVPKGQPTGTFDENGDPAIGTGEGTPSIVVPGEPEGDTEDAEAEHRRRLAKVLDDAGSDDTGTAQPAPPPEFHDPVRPQPEPMPEPERPL